MCAISARQFKGVNNPEVIVRTSDKPAEAINRIRLCLTELYGGVRFLTDVLDGTVSGVFDHGILAGLGDDDHTQYWLKAGRSGGTVAYGGTGASDAAEIISSTGTSGPARIQVTSTPSIIFDVPAGTVDPLTLSLGLVSGTLTGTSLTFNLNATGGNASSIRINNTSGGTATNQLTIDKVASQTGRMARFRGASPTFTELTYVGANGEVSIAPDADVVGLYVNADAILANALVVDSPSGLVQMLLAVSGNDGSTSVKNLRLSALGVGTGFYVQHDSTGITANRTVTWQDVSGIPLLRTGSAINTTGRTTSVATSTLVASPTTQFYQINAYMHCSTAGDPGDNVILNLLWDDGSGVKTKPLATLDLSVAGSYATYTASFYHTAGTNLRYSTTLTSPGAGTPAHSIRLRATALG